MKSILEIDITKQNENPPVPPSQTPPLSNYTN